MSMYNMKCLSKMPFFQQISPQMLTLCYVKYDNQEHVLCQSFSRFKLAVVVTGMACTGGITTKAGSVTQNNEL